MNIQCTTITRENINNIKNDSFRRYAEKYLNIEDDTNSLIEGFGLPFNTEKYLVTKNDAIKSGATSRNNGKSIYLNWISPACKACKTGDKILTTFISLKCHKNCYFCFNPNQENYKTFRVNDKDPIAELNGRFELGQEFDHIALTGGEPLLHVEKTVEFFKFINKKSPDTYTRLYTAGDLLTRDILQSLKDAQLDEIRFSIKQEETPAQKETLFAIMAMAKEYIPYVVVEMPVIPGTLAEMKLLLNRLDEIGVKGINLLEFCFPLYNAKQFEKRGFDLKFPPYETYYNYWYAGGLAVAKSEEECLKLVKYASDQSLRLGVHYCSLENKHTGQLYKQNKHIKLPEPYSFSNKDYFIKTAKVFGKDKAIVAKRLQENGNKYFEEGLDNDYLQFSIYSLSNIKDLHVDVAICSFVCEVRDGEEVLREVKVEQFNP